MCSGAEKSSLALYFVDYNKNLNAKNQSEENNESFISQKIALLKEIENLKKLKECEAACTMDLKKIIMSGATNSYLKVFYK